MIDLHVHSNQSDGSFSCEDLLKKAEAEGLNLIAKCDHDTTSGNNDFTEMAQAYNINGVPGVEISADWRNGNCHILGLGVDSENQPLEDALYKIRDSRNGRNEKIIGKLNELGFSITVEEVQELAGGEVTGRPHMSRLLVDKGYVGTTQEAFDKYLAKGMPAYADRFRLEPEEAVRILYQASAQVVLAHPSQLKLESGELVAFVKRLKAYGLSGIETFTYYADDKEIEEYKTIASENNLFNTGGSDFHGESKPDHELGCYRAGLRIPEECADILRA